MTALLVVAAVAVIGCIVYVVLRRPQIAAEVTEPSGDGEFADLSEAERCDYVFALGALDGSANLQRLLRAMDDPSEAVAIAAARTLILAGRRDEVDSALAQRSGERAARIVSALDLLA